MSTFNVSNFRAEVLGKGLAKSNRFEIEFTMPTGIHLMPEYTAVYNPPNDSIFKQIGNVLGTVGAIGGIIKNRGLGSLIATNAISAITGATKDKPLTLQDDRRVCLLCEVANFPALNISVKQQRIFGPAYQFPVTSEYGGEGISLTFLVDREMTAKRLFDAWMETIVAGGTNNSEWQNTYTVGFPNEYLTNIDIKQLDEFDNVVYAVRLEDAFPRTMNMMDLNMSTQNQVHRLTMMFAYRRWYPILAQQSAQQTQTGGVVNQLTGFVKGLF